RSGRAARRWAPRRTSAHRASVDHLPVWERGAYESESPGIRACRGCRATLREIVWARGRPMSSRWSEDYQRPWGSTSIQQTLRWRSLRRPPLAVAGPAPLDVPSALVGELGLGPLAVAAGARVVGVLRVLLNPAIRLGGGEAVLALPDHQSDSSSGDSKAIAQSVTGTIPPVPHWMVKGVSAPSSFRSTATRS